MFFEFLLVSQEHLDTHHQSGLQHKTGSVPTSDPWAAAVDECPTAAHARQDPLLAQHLEHWGIDVMKLLAADHPPDGSHRTVWERPAQHWRAPWKTIVYHHILYNVHIRLPCLPVPQEKNQFYNDIVCHDCLASGRTLGTSRENGGIRMPRRQKGFRVSPFVCTYTCPHGGQQGQQHSQHPNDVDALFLFSQAPLL